jgi:spore germination cell wall hydrolase CwlJ-like protein
MFHTNIVEVIKTSQNKYKYQFSFWCFGEEEEQKKLIPKQRKDLNKR